MDIKDFFSIIYKRIWIVAVIPLIAAVVSAYISFFVLNNVYKSDMTLYVINKKDDPQTSIAYNDLMVGQQLVNDYRELLKSRTITSSVIEKLELSDELTPAGLAKRISIGTKNDTRVIQIEVEDEDPERSCKIANTVGEVFVEKVAELMKEENVNIIDNAEIPQKPSSPRPIVNILAVFMTGLIMSVGIAFLVEYLDDTIKTLEDVDKYLNLTVVGIIPTFDIA